MTEADLQVIIHDRIRLTIEMQVRKDPDFFKRSFLYVSSAFQKGYHDSSRMISPNRPYSSLIKSIGLNFMNYIGFEGDNDIYRYYQPPYDEVHDDYGFESSVFVEFKKQVLDIDDPVRKANILYWIQFFTTGEVGAGAPDYIKEACELVKYENLTKEEQIVIDAIERARLEQQLNDNYKIEIATKRGRLEGKLETARNLLAKGVDINLISEATQLSIKDIRDLQ